MADPRKSRISPNFGRSQHELYVFPCSFQDEEARFSAVQAPAQPAPRSHWPSEPRRRYGYGKAPARRHGSPQKVGSRAPGSDDIYIYIHYYPFIRFYNWNCTPWYRTVPSNSSVPGRTNRWKKEVSSNFQRPMNGRI